MPETVTPQPVRKTNFNPKKPRPGESVGGGYFVFRRGHRTGRIRPALWPFEHDTRPEAEAEANKLAAAHPGERFVVVEQVYDVAVDLPKDTPDA